MTLCIKRIGELELVDSAGVKVIRTRQGVTVATVDSIILNVVFPVAAHYNWEAIRWLAGIAISGTPETVPESSGTVPESPVPESDTDPVMSDEEKVEAAPGPEVKVALELLKTQTEAREQQLLSWKILNQEELENLEVQDQYQCPGCQNMIKDRQGKKFVNCPICLVRFPVQPVHPDDLENFEEDDVTLRERVRVNIFSGDLSKVLLPAELSRYQQIAKLPQPILIINAGEGFSAAVLRALGAQVIAVDSTVSGFYTYVHPETGYFAAREYFARTMLIEYPDDGIVDDIGFRGKYVAVVGPRPIIVEPWTRSDYFEDMQLSVFSHPLRKEYKPYNLHSAHKSFVEHRKDTHRVTISDMISMALEKM